MDVSLDCIMRVEGLIDTVGSRTPGEWQEFGGGAPPVPQLHVHRNLPLLDRVACAGGRQNIDAFV